MPRGDGTGPRGMGMMSGRRAGYCAGFGMPGYANPIPGRGMGMGFGRGMGRWRGFAAYPPQPMAVEPEMEADMLRNQLDTLRTTLDTIQKRLDQIEKSTSKETTT